MFARSLRIGLLVVAGSLATACIAVAATGVEKPTLTVSPTKNVVSGHAIVFTGTGCLEAGVSSSRIAVAIGTEWGDFGPFVINSPTGQWRQVIKLALPSGVASTTFNFECGRAGVVGGAGTLEVLSARPTRSA